MIPSVMDDNEMKSNCDSLSGRSGAVEQSNCDQYFADFFVLNVTNATLHFALFGSSLRSFFRFTSRNFTAFSRCSEERRGRDEKRGRERREREREEKKKEERRRRRVYVQREEICLKGNGLS